MSNKNQLSIINRLVEKFKRGETFESYENLKKYIKKNKEDLNAIYNFAIMSESINNDSEAIKCYNFIIQKKNTHWQSIFNLYLIYIKTKKFDDAIPLVDKLLKIKPNYQPALRDKAYLLYQINQEKVALPFINESINLNNKDYLAYNIQGLIHLKINNLKKAILAFKKTIDLNIAYYPGYNNLGRCYQLQENLYLAFKNYKKSFRINKNYSDAIINIANILQIKGKHEKAIEYYFDSLNKDGNKQKIYANISYAYSNLKNFSKTKEYFEKAIKLNPNDHITKQNFSFTLLYQQNYQNAWEFYESRLFVDSNIKLNTTFENIKNFLIKTNYLEDNSTLLVVKEQGIGDQILFSSIYPDLLKKFPKTKIEIDDRLIEIYKRSFGHEESFVSFPLFSSNINKIKNFDHVLYNGSLGKFFRKKINDFPKKKYLSADPLKIKKIQRTLNLINNLPKIGISWKSIVNINGKQKSFKLNQLLPILKIQKWSFVNLQYGNTEKERNIIKNKHQINILAFDKIDLFNDFENLAALLSSVDIFLTVSNSTAHLAGALGVKTILISPQKTNLYHYWNQPGKHSPWYPNLEIIKSEKSFNLTINNIINKIEKTI